MPVGFSLAAGLCWGTSDFSGGYASSRSDSFLMTALAHGSGLRAHAGAGACLTTRFFPQPSSRLWAAAAGASGGPALLIFYRALSTGMGLTAPVAAVLGAAIPAAFTMITHGLPGKLGLAGFLLAGLGIWLISRPDGSATIAEFSPPPWPASALPDSSSASIAPGTVRRYGRRCFRAWLRFCWWAPLFWFGGNRGSLLRSDASLALFAGCLDVSGTALFIRADQTGRLDSAVVVSSLYPVLTVLLAWFFLKEKFTRWKTVGIFAALRPCL